MKFNIGDKHKIHNSRDEKLGRRMLELKVSSRLTNIILNSNYDRSKMLSAIETVEEYQQNYEIKYPNVIINCALLEGWLSKQLIQGWKESEKIDKELADFDMRIKLNDGSIGIEELPKKTDKIKSVYHVDEYQRWIEIFKIEFAQNIDKTDYILNMRDDFTGLKKRTRTTIKKHIDQMIASGADFDEVYFEAGRMIIGFLLPNRIIMENDNEI